MKKWIALLLALAMVFTLAACGGGDKDPADDESEEVSDRGERGDEAEDEEQPEDGEQPEEGDEAEEPEEDSTAGDEAGAAADDNSGAAADDNSGSASDDSSGAAADDESGESTSGGIGDSIGGTVAVGGGDDSTPAASQEPVEGEIVLIDDENITFKITDIDPNGEWGYTLSVYLENKSDLNLMFTLSDAAINHVMCDPYWGTDVPAGKKINDTIDWDTEDLAYYGIEDVRVIDLAIRVYDNDDWQADDLIDSVYTIYPQGDTAETLQLPARQTTEGEAVLVDNENVTFSVLGSYVDETWGYTLVCFLENKTDTYLMFSMDDVSVNGYMCDPFWGTEVMPGMQAYAEIDWNEDDFETNGIETVTEVEFTLSVYDNVDWSADDLVNETFTLSLAG